MMPPIRFVATAAAIAVGTLLAAGCGSSNRHQAAAPPASTPGTQASSPAPTLPSPSTSTALATPPPTTAPPVSSVGAEPTLGALTGTFAHGSGFGQVEPKAVDNGGDNSSSS